MSQRLGLLDEWIALDIDQAAMLCVEFHRDEKETRRLNALIIGASTRALSAFAGAEGEQQLDGDVFINGPTGDEGYINSSVPVYKDGQFMGNSQCIPMSEEEFIKRTVAPPSPPSGDRWWATTGSPRIIGGQGSGGRVVDFNDPDVV